MNRNNVSAESTIDEPTESFLEKIKKSKKKIIIGGAFVGAIAIGGIIIFKNRDAMKIFSFEETANSVTPLDAIQLTRATPETNMPRGSLNCAPFVVQGHPRNLPERYHASQDQITLAESLGIKLESNQTFVRTYQKCAS